MKCHHAKSYLEKLQGDWRLLVEFMIRTQVYKMMYPHVNGTSHLNLTEYKEDARLLSLSKSYATLKTETDKIQVVFCCQITNLSMRLVVMASEDDIPVEADNEYADTAVGYLITQINSCWKSLPTLLNNDIIHHLFVRKFESCTVSLLLAGTENRVIKKHKMPMKNEILQLKKCNFEDQCFREQRGKFPTIIYQVRKVDYGYFNDLSCCCPDEYQ